MVESLVIPFVVVVRDELAPGRPEERVAVMEEDPEVSQASVLGLGGVPHELGDPHSPSPWAAHQDQHSGQAAWRPGRARLAVGRGGLGRAPCARWRGGPARPDDRGGRGPPPPPEDGCRPTRGSRGPSGRCAGGSCP